MKAVSLALPGRKAWLRDCGRAPWLTDELATEEAGGEGKEGERKPPMLSASAMASGAGAISITGGLADVLRGVYVEHWCMLFGWRADRPDTEPISKNFQKPAK